MPPARGRVSVFRWNSVRGATLSRGWIPFSETGKHTNIERRAGRSWMRLRKFRKSHGEHHKEITLTVCEGRDGMQKTRCTRGQASPEPGRQATVIPYVCPHLGTQPHTTDDWSRSKLYTYASPLQNAPYKVSTAEQRHLSLQMTILRHLNPESSQVGI